MSKGVLSERSKGRRERGLQGRHLSVAARDAMLGRCVLEMLENRRLLSVTIPLLNSDFESPTWVNSGGSYSLQPVGAGTQAPNYNELDPRFGIQGWAKTAVDCYGWSGVGLTNGSIGPNGEGIYNEFNTGSAVSAPGNGTQYFCVQPSGFKSDYAPTFSASYSSAWSNNWPSNGQASSVSGYGYHYTQGSSELPMMYDFWIDQQSNITSGIPLGGANYPPMIPATTAIAGHTYQATVALGNPSWNATNGNTAFPVVELSFTSGAWGGPGGYNGYGNTIAQAWANGSSDSNWQIAPGTFKDLTLTWTCPQNLGGQSLNIQLNVTGFTQTPGTSQPNKVAFDNIRFVDVTAAPTAPAAPSGLTAAAASTSQINLSWTDNSSSETGFKIDQATNSTFTAGLTTATVGANVTTYSATGLSASSTYYYRVRATNDIGDSANTSTASATTAAPGTPFVVPVPDGDFASDAAAYRINSNSGGGLTFTSPMTATLSGWNISANPSTASGGYYSSGGWEPYGAVDSVTSGGSASPFSTNAPSLGNQPASNYHAFMYYPGELYSYGSVVAGAQPGASLTMTTTGISLAAVTGSTYTATIQYANVSWSSTNVNPSANVALSILANGVVVGTGTLSGLAQGAPWTTVTAGWVADAAHAGQAIQIQVVATNFLEGPGNSQQWQVPAFGFAHATLTATEPVGLPAAPGGLTATTASSSQINLSWADNSNNETGFKIDQATSSDFSTGLTTLTVGANVTTYSATGLSSGTTYYYRVRATNANGDSANAAMASATTQGVVSAAPSGLTATAISTSQINLNWTDNSNNEAGFKIDQATSSDFSTGLTTVTVAANVTTYSATGLAAGATYYYRVRATNAVGDSANTSTASASTATTAVIPIPNASFENVAAGVYTPNPVNGTATWTSSQTGTIPGWSMTLTPTTYNGGAYNGWVPYGKVCNASDNYDWMSSQDGTQHLTLSGGELFSGYPGSYGWPQYGVIPAQTWKLNSTGITATTVAGSTYTATIAVTNPLWHTVGHMTPAQLAAYNLAVASPNFELDIVANGQVVASNTVLSPTAGQWFDLTTTWTATTSGQSIQLQAVATNFSEGAMGPGHTLQTPEGPQPWTATDASFDNARLTVTAPVGLPAAPSGLTATAASASQINLSWTDNSSNETGFKIDQATSPDFSTGLTTATVGANVTTYSATGLSAGTTYYYRVRSTSATGDSASTSSASATTATVGTPVAIPVPDGDFTDAPGFFINANNGSHGPFVGPMNATLSGWAVTASPSTDYSGVYGSWNPYGGVDNTITNYPANGNFGVSYSGSMPGGATNLFFYYPGEQLTGNTGSRVAQTGAGLTLTTTGISAAAVSGTTYAASIYYANLAGNGSNNGPNLTLNILAGGVVVGTGTVTGLAPGSPWTEVTATWTASSHIGDAIQLQVVASNFIEGTSPWLLPNFGLTHATLMATASSSVPVAPSGLTAASASSSAVNLTWTDNSTDETGFKVERATDSGFTQNLQGGTVAANIASYAAIGLSLNTRYYFRVRALGSGGDSGFSSWVQGMLRLGDANLDGQVDLTDLSILASNWQKTGRIFADGDFNGDGAVDLTDLSILAGQWQTPPPVPAPAPVVAAPVAGPVGAPVITGAAVVADDAAQPIAVRADLPASAPAAAMPTSETMSQRAAPVAAAPVAPVATTWPGKHLVAATVAGRHHSAQRTKAPRHSGVFSNRPLPVLTALAPWPVTSQGTRSLLGSERGILAGSDDVLVRDVYSRRWR